MFKELFTESENLFESKITKKMILLPLKIKEQKQKYIL